MLARLATLLVATAGLLGGCYSASPTLFQTSTDTYTYESTARLPVNVDLVDTRDETVFFSMQVPVGKQLSFHFDETGGDDPVLRPSRMTWAIMAMDSMFGSLSNVMSAPPAYARRIDLSYRKAGEFAPEPVEGPMRVEPGEKKEWQTPSGGAAPTPNAKKLYD